MLSFMACLLVVAHRPGACEIEYLNAYVSDRQGKPAAAPKAGEPFAITVVYNVYGTPTRPFKLQTSIGGFKSVVNEIGLANGRFTSICAFNGIECLGKLPCEIVIDPEGVSGDSNREDNGTRTTFEHAPAKEPIEYFGTRRYALTHTYHADGLDKAPKAAFLGRAVSESWQRVMSETPIGVATPTLSDKMRQPLWEFPAPSPEQGNLTIGTRTEVALSRVRINDAMARKVNWEQVKGLPPELETWKEPSRGMKWKDPRVQDFIKRVLPTDYRSKMGPYDAAEKVYLAFLKFFHYDYLPAATAVKIETEGATAYLDQGWGACHGYAYTLSALFRAIGLPARNVSVFANLDTAKGQVGTGGVKETAKSTAEGHAMCEFYLPTVGWIPVDGTRGDVASPNGDHPFGFGVLDLSRTFRTSVGDDHTYQGRYFCVSEWGSLDGMQGRSVKQYWRALAKPLDR